MTTFNKTNKGAGLRRALMAGFAVLALGTVPLAAAQAAPTVGVGIGIGVPGPVVAPVVPAACAPGYAYDPAYGCAPYGYYGYYPGYWGPTVGLGFGFGPGWGWGHGWGYGYGWGGRGYGGHGFAGHGFGGGHGFARAGHR